MQLILLCLWKKTLKTKFFLKNVKPIQTATNEISEIKLRINTFW